MLWKIESVFFETIFVVENNISLFLDCGFYLSEDKYFENISNNKKNEIETLWFILYYIVYCILKVFLRIII